MYSAQSSRKALLAIFSQALTAVDGHTAVRNHLQKQAPDGPLQLVAVGKAAQSMALGAAEVLGDAVSGGLVVSKPGHLEPQRLADLGLDCVVGGHPLPTAGSLEAGRRLLELLQSGSQQPLLFLFSGGASSLLELPVAGLALADLERAGQWLLGSGLDIGAMNRVRKSLSRIKGGGLLRWLQGRRVTALAISDVPGDDPGVIGSGPLVPEVDLAAQVRKLALPDWLGAWVEQGLAERGEISAAGPRIQIVANLDRARRTAAEAAREQGYQVRLHGEFIDGDAAQRGAELAGYLMQGPPGLHIWGGETTVMLPPEPGRGGRNQHLALAAAAELAGTPGVYFLSAGTDGTDGPTDDAGALVDGGTLERAALDGFEARSCLAAANAGSLLESSGDLVQTGPTGTNVMDLMIGLKSND
jgi:glycerate 2-kinase